MTTTTIAPPPTTYITAAEETWRAIIDDAHARARSLGLVVRTGHHKSEAALIYVSGAGNGRTRILARKDAGTIHKANQVNTGRVDIYPKMPLPQQLAGKPVEDLIAHLVGWLTKESHHEPAA